MTTDTERMYLWSRFTLREALLLGFCATFIMLTRAGLRLHLHMPGHVMFFTMFFFLLARGCVPKIGAATLVGLITSLASTLFGMGKAGPIVLVKFLLPALIVEAAGIISPGFITSLAACAAVGLIASVVRSLTSSGLEWLIGMEEDVILRKAAITAGLNGFYGALGSLAVPSVVRRLQRNGLVERRSGEIR